MKIQSFFHKSNVHLFWMIIILLVCGTRQSLKAQPTWNDQAASLIADVRAHQLGDILTIIIQENKTASKNTSKKSSKSSGIDAGIESFFFSPGTSSLLTKGGQLPSLKLNGASSFEGSGNVTSSERMTTKLSVRIIDELPNRQFLVEGAQKTSFGGALNDKTKRGWFTKAWDKINPF